MMNLNDLVESIASSSKTLLTAIGSGETIKPLNMRRSARLPVLSSLYNSLHKSILFITDRVDHALTINEELGLWLPNSLRFLIPEPTPLFYEEAAWGEATRRDRLIALTNLAMFHIPGSMQSPLLPILIAPIRALMTRTMPRRDYLKASRSLPIGEVIQPDELTRSCITLGYDPVNVVITTGQFARRGGIFDLWPPAEDHPVRIEFFGDEIETIRRFDPSSQRTIQQSRDIIKDRILLTPAREFLLHQNSNLGMEVKKATEFHIASLHPTPASLIDYLPRDALIILDDSRMIAETANEIEEQAVQMRREFIREGGLPADFPIPYLSWSEIEDSLGRFYLLDFGHSDISELEAFENPTSGQTNLEIPLAARFYPEQRFAGRLKPVLDHLVQSCTRDEKIVVISRQAARLKELWQELRLNLPHSEPSFIDGSLGEGWIFKDIVGNLYHLLTDGEVFGWRRPEPRRRARPLAESPETFYSDLQPGDYLVHVDHGIGHFVGLVNRSVDGIEREYLCVEYADEAQLFVPVHQADRLSRYVGPDNRTPLLSRLGSIEWRNVKAHVKEAVKQVAQELLNLYAQRNIIKGFPFSPDNNWQQELEASFPYIETEDQLRVLAEVKADMQKDQPMDRLICGDVGYGKTEVALRAAFKAILDGKQVAMLVPTTVLAQQHYHTFRQRLSAFPVEVEMLSRFRTLPQQRQIISCLEKGKIDIIIGTHRLLSSDVKFKDLGLLIIDEEQRFGVMHKETLKRLRTEVDILTMTATPIPRTLYMALSGIRDISTINTPPEERLPIVTHVGPYSPRLVKQAILREIERGGQIFFVHNRIQTIHAMQTHLLQQVPDVKIAIAHGQMNESDLAQRMEEFTSGEVDLLLSTSIIESGLDIPNANTLIVDRADTFGLAQLYQLRGRVGRGAQRAYAYFFRHNRKLPSFEGRQRLDTIAENSQLGAGFSIAMRDLEIRGTGDILGTRQSGHIAAVGFHLYTSMLADAVRKQIRSQSIPVKALPPSLNLQLNPVNVDLPIPTGIPSHYVVDKSIRLGLYRRMADLRNMIELDTLKEEFIDRFGPAPEEVENLFFQLKLKILAEKAGLSSISFENRQLVIRFPEGGIPENLPNLGSNTRVGKTALWMRYSDPASSHNHLIELLYTLQPADAAETRG